MPTSKIIPLAVINIAYYVCGALLIFRTRMLVELGRGNYGKSRLAQASPLSSIVMKPSYPTFIRGAGIFVWLWALAIDCAVLFGGFS
jgi:hypothetical protein